MKKRISIFGLILIFLICIVSTCKSPPEMIKIEICIESELLPNEYCPETEIREYEKGKEPTEICIIHKFRPSIYAIESCYDIMTAKGDLLKWLEAVSDIGANGVRFFAIQTWGQHDKWHPFQPYPVVGKHPDRDLPLFRLGEWNEAWWDRYKAILNKMKELGLTAHIVAEDMCSGLKQSGDEKHKNPMVGSEEALSPATPGGVWGKAMRQYHLALFRRLILEAWATEVNFTFEPMNEYDAIDWSDAFMIAWHQWAIDEARKIYPDIKIITSASRNMEEIKKQVNEIGGLYSAHGFVRPEKIDEFYTKYGSEGFLISGDGGWDGDGRPDAKGRRGSSPVQLERIAEKMFKYGYPGHERFDRGLYFRNNDIANLDDYDDSAMRVYVKKCEELEKQLCLEYVLRLLNPEFKHIQNRLQPYLIFAVSRMCPFFDIYNYIK